jgi:uncharacterized membrane protein
MYDKHLLTNNKSVKKSNYYNPNNILIINENDDISNWINSKVEIINSLKKEKSPLYLLKLIEQIL